MKPEIGKEYLIKNEDDCVIAIVEEINEECVKARIVYGYSVQNSRILNYNKIVQHEREDYEEKYADFYESVDVIDPYSDDYIGKLKAFRETRGLDYKSIANWNRIDPEFQVLKSFEIEDIVFTFGSPDSKNIRIPFNTRLTSEQISMVMELGFCMLDPFDFDECIIHVDHNGVYYNVDEMMQICIRLYPEHEASDIVYNGIISSVNSHKCSLEEERPIHFVRDYCYHSDEGGESVKIDGDDWYFD